MKIPGLTCTRGQCTNRGHESCTLGLTRETAPHLCPDWHEQCTIGDCQDDFDDPTRLDLQIVSRILLEIPTVLVDCWKLI